LHFARLTPNKRAIWLPIHR